MKKTLFILFALSMLLPMQMVAKVKGKTVKVTYEASFNGKARTGTNTVMEISNDVAKIYTISEKEGKSPQQVTYLDFGKNEEIKVATVKGEEILTKREFEIGKGLTNKPETAVIAGYNCKKVQTTINSNTLEVWYTTEIEGFKGSMQPSVAIIEGVVLKVVRNGSTAETATKVEFEKAEKALMPSISGEPLKASAYNYKIQQSQVLAYRVFDKQDIYFREIPKVKKLSDTEIMQFAAGSIVMKKVKLPENNEGYSIFAELSQRSVGDAYDRTGSVFIVPTDRKQSFFDGMQNGVGALPQYTDKHGNKYQGMVTTPDYLPPVELLRFYTSFGASGYNHIQVADYNWPDSVVYKQEVTDYAKMLKGEVWVGAWIGNYVANAHNVTLDIKFYPNEKQKEKEVYPLFTTTNILEMAGQSYPEAMFRDDALTVDFTTDVDLEDAYIRYISTGHGGWGGGDEFNPKLNTITVDGKQVIAYTPWREDCGSYRNSNPASGNFANGLSSSDLSRSGWCPGTVSYPVFVHIGSIKAGKHQLKLTIPVGDPAGSSNSYWCTSGVLVGNGIEK